MELIKKLAKAKECIKNTKIEKKGNNTFSNYKYFTPDQVELLVSDACKEAGILTTFELLRDELGEKGVLTIWDIEKGDKLSFTMATAIPSIKATNIAQQLGGCVTYTERYIKMSTFGISDNSLDFDDTQNTKKTTEQKDNEEIVQKTLGAADSKTITKVVDWANKNNMTITSIEKYYKMSKTTKDKITPQLKTK